MPARKNLKRVRTVGIGRPGTTTASELGRCGSDYVRRARPQTTELRIRRRLTRDQQEWASGSEEVGG